MENSLLEYLAFVKTVESGSFTSAAEFKDRKDPAPAVRIFVKHLSASKANRLFRPISI